MNLKEKIQEEVPHLEVKIILNRNKGILPQLSPLTEDLHQIY